MVRPKMPASRHGATLFGGDGENVPGAMGEPLFLPTPVVVRTGLFVGEVVIDAIFVLEASGDAVGNSARRGGGSGIEEERLRIVAADAIHHGRVKGI